MLYTSSAIMLFALGTASAMNPSLNTMTDDNGNKKIAINVYGAGGDVTVTQHADMGGGSGSDMGMEYSILSEFSSLNQQTQENANGLVDLHAEMVSQVSGVQSNVDDTQSDLSSTQTAMIDEFSRTRSSLEEEVSTLQSQLSAAESAHVADADQLSRLVDGSVPSQLQGGGWAVAYGAYSIKVMVDFFTADQHGTVSIEVDYRLESSQTWSTATFVGPISEGFIDGDNHAGLRPSSRYRVRVRGVNAAGPGSYSSEIVVQTQGVPADGSADYIKCDRTPDTKLGVGRVTACTMNVQLYHSAVFYASFNGHYKSVLGSGTCHAGISFDNDNAVPGNDAAQIKQNAYGSSMNWENMHTSRTSGILQPGNHTIKIIFENKATTMCQFRGWGLHAMIAKYTANKVFTGACKNSRTSMTMNYNSQVCRLGVTTRQRSIHMMSVNGAVRTGHVYLVGSFDNDGRGQVSNMWRLPAHSYSNTYENFGSHRVKILNTGAHTTEAYTGSSGTYRLGSLSHLVIPTDPARGTQQRFSCVSPRGWGNSNYHTTESAILCESTITLPYPAVVHAEFTGHYHSSRSGLAASIVFDEDETELLESIATSPSNTSNFGDSQIFVGFTNQWECARTQRKKILPAGRHKVTARFKPLVDARWSGMNGWGMNGFWTRYAPLASSVTV